MAKDTAVVAEDHPAIVCSAVSLLETAAAAAGATDELLDRTVDNPAAVSHHSSAVAKISAVDADVVRSFPQQQAAPSYPSPSPPSHSVFCHSANHLRTPSSFLSALCPFGS